MKFLATGEIKAAEQQKLATIQHAEGEREVVIQVAQGRAEAIRLVKRPLKRLETVENSLRDNAKTIVTENGISPTPLLESLPNSVSDEKRTKKAVLGMQENSL